VYLGFSRLVVATTSKKNRLFSPSKAERQTKKGYRWLTPLLATLVAVVEFDGGRLYQRKEHRLALLLIPNLAKSPVCVRSYVHFAVINWHSESPVFVIQNLE
jgi:hypothetical protein